MKIRGVVTCTPYPVPLGVCCRPDVGDAEIGVFHTGSSQNALHRADDTVYILVREFW